MVLLWPQSSPSTWLYNLRPTPMSRRSLGRRAMSLRHDEGPVVVEQEAAEDAMMAVGEDAQEVAWPQPTGQLRSDAPCVGSRGGSLS